MNLSLLYRVARICFAAATVFMLMEARAEQPASPPKRIVGYVTEWGDYRATDIPADLVTHINYAFARITSGECTFSKAKTPTTDRADAPPKRLAELQQLKREHPQLKTLVSLGGWGGSGAFS